MSAPATASDVTITAGEIRRECPSAIPREREPGEAAPCVLRLRAPGYPIEEDLLEMESILYWRPEHLKGDVRSFIRYMGKASPCATVRREPFPGDDEPLLMFATGGWSGNEEFIDRLLAAGNPRGMVRLMFLHGWRRGGAWWFDVLDEEPTP